MQADRWLTQNKNLSGDMLKAAVDKESWDDSVNALVATPPVLTMMSSKLDWLQKLGDAVLAQQADVSAAIQRLRVKAQGTGKLITTPQQKVTVEQQDTRKIIVIEQTNDDTIYVPAYDPSVVYGAWPYADYPPYYWGYPGLAPGVLARGLWFGAGYGLGRWASGAYGWGGRVNWGNGNIVRSWPRATPYNVTNINNIGNRSGNTWQHNPAHRQGVRYNNAGVQQRFGNQGLRAGAGQRADFRGRVASAGGGAGAGAALRGAPQRTAAAARPAQRQSGANRRLPKNLWNPDVIRAVAQRDVVFGCMDTVDGRYLLNAPSTYYTIPYFDIGVRLDAVRDGAGKGRIREVCGTVNYLRPGRSSLMSRGLFTMADVATAGLRRNDPAAHAQQMKDGYIKGVAGNRPAVISVNMLDASLAVSEFLARLHPFREEPNDRYGAVIFSLASMEIITEPEEGVCEILRRHVGAGDTTPLLGLMELAETRPA